MDRLVQRNVLAIRGRAVEAAGDCSTLLLDKTGTITSATARRPSSSRCAGRRRARARRRRAALEPRRRDARGPLDRRRSPKERYGLRARELARRRARAVHRPDPHERRRLRRPLDPQGRGRLGRGAGSRSEGGAVPRELGRDRRRHRDAGRHAARRRRETAAPLGVDPPEGHREAGHARALRRAARDGHPHGDDHRRQPAHRARRSPPRPASTTSSPRRRPRTRWR